MNRIAKKAIVSALAAGAMSVSLLGFTATSASAANSVSCDSPDYVHVSGHRSLGALNQGEFENCYANGGEVSTENVLNPAQNTWVSQISTGNNHVVYFADGKWQPDEPIAPHTTYTWPNNPDGVHIEKIAIV